MENQTTVQAQNSQIEQTPVNQTPQAPEKPKVNYLAIGLTGLISAVIFGFGGYYVGSKQALNTQQNPTTTPVVKVSESTPVSTAPDATSNWKTYTSQKYGLSFKYPQEYILLSSDDLTGATSYSIFLYSDKDKQELLVNFRLDESKRMALEDFGEQKTPNPAEFPVMKVGGKEYPTTKYIFGEGVPGYGSCVNSSMSTRYLSEINSNLVIELHRAKNVECNPDGTSKVTKEITDSEFETGVQILSTVKFSN